jgi:hypothetical protein|tara:strand:- start:13226 stop:15217 length:1992 start_codon:yes stop_codon:yes gene_type:complete
MSYIIKSTQPFTSVKLTETGREKLAKGQLNFNSWSIGDSEINYKREAFIQDGTLTGDTAIVLRPKDKQPNLKYFINKGGTTNNFSFGGSDIRCIKLTVNNEADERGLFTGNLATGFTTNTSSYVRTSGTSITISGGTSVTISGAVIGDFLLVKTGYSGFTNETPAPHLWFKVQNVVGSTVTVDRELPNIGSINAVIIYKGGNIYDNEPDSIAYWDTGTLSFDSSCDITTMDVPLWNMNVPFSEDIMGVTGSTYENHINYGSYNFLGQKANSLYSPSDNINSKSIAIIHYSNKTISNLYGEFFFIDNDTKTVKIHLPDLMYHRRKFSGSTTGDKMGMTFVASGTSVSTGANGLTYIPLIEDPILVNGTPKQVGRVYTQLKIMTIDDAEIIAAMSYKSNRNWTLPRLDLNQVNPSSGVGTGILGAGKTIYATYVIDNESGTGISEALPCQNYVSHVNNSSTSVDIQFNVEDTGLFPYIRDNGSSGGFYGDKFKVLYQITDGERPLSDAWQEIDYTSSVLTASFVDSTKLEIQNPNAASPTIFELNATTTSGSTIYSLISKLSMAPITSPEILQFGDERFFYGNVEAFIGATIFKTIFKVTINASDFSSTTNVTRSSNPQDNPANIKVSEVGIYDSDGELIIISKLSQPVELTPGKTVILELGIDF